MQGIELVLVLRRLGQHLLGALQGCLERRLQLRVTGDLAADIPCQAAQPGAHLLEPAQALLVAAGVHQPGRFAPRLNHHAGEGLPQLHPVPLRQTYQPLGSAQQEVAVGRMRHCLGLYRGVDRHPLKLPLVDRSGLHRH